MNTYIAQKHIFQLLFFHLIYDIRDKHFFKANTETQKKLWG